MTGKSLSLVVMAGLFVAMDVAVAQSVRDLRFSSRNLSFSTRDLRFASTEERFHTGDILATVDSSPRERRFRLSGDVLFEFDRDEIHPGAAPVLVGLANKIRSDFAGAPIRVEGHTDSIGSDSYNLELSVRRADSVKVWFQSRGFSVPIQATGFGEAQPVEPNHLPDGSDNPVGRQKNRRVEVVLEIGG